MKRLAVILMAFATFGFDSLYASFPRGLLGTWQAIGVKDSGEEERGTIQARRLKKNGAITIEVTRGGALKERWTMYHNGRTQVLLYDDNQGVIASGKGTWKARKNGFTLFSKMNLRALGGLTGYLRARSQQVSRDKWVAVTGWGRSSMEAGTKTTTTLTRISK